MLPAPSDRSAPGASTCLVSPCTLSLVKLALDLSEAQAQALLARAKTLGVAPEDLARAAIADALSAPSEPLRAAAERLLADNAELYKRLA